PQLFKWRFMDKDKKLSDYKSYSPQQFYKEVVDEDLDNYFVIYSNPTRAFDKLYAVQLSKAVHDGPDFSFVNCNLELLKVLTKNSLLDNMPVWFACDVNKDSDDKTGLFFPGVYDYESFYNMDFKLSRKELFESYETVPTHGMVFVGMDVVDGKVEKWLVENSGGSSSGKNGYYHLLDQWYDYFVHSIIIHKKFIPPDILAIYDSKPEILPPWDPMA
ncbi:MAG: hypothetical protein GY757_29395, partial [bacterium]|nr:hypothetical protein [bacterium]